VPFGDGDLPDGTAIVLGCAVEDSIAVVVGIGAAVSGFEVVVVLGGIDTAVEGVWYAVEISVRLAGSRWCVGRFRFRDAQRSCISMLVRGSGSDATPASR